MKILFVILISLQLISCMNEPSLENKIDEIFSEFTNQSPGASVLILQNSDCCLGRRFIYIKLQFTVFGLFTHR